MGNFWEISQKWNYLFPSLLRARDIKMLFWDFYSPTILFFIIKLPLHVSEIVFPLFLVLTSLPIYLYNRCEFSFLRGHTVKAVCESFHLAKDSGFKVVAHMMPDLPNVGLERDIEQFTVSVALNQANLECLYMLLCLPSLLFLIIYCWFPYHYLSNMSSL